MTPSPDLEDALRALSLRMVRGETEPGGTDVAGSLPTDDLLPLDVDRSRGCAATLIAHLRPSGVTTLYLSRLLREKSGWRTEAIGSRLPDAARPPGGEVWAPGESSGLIGSGVMPWSGFYLCCRYLVAGPDVARLRVARRERAVPDHRHLIVVWRSRQRIVEWGPGISVTSGPGRAPRMVAVTRDGTERPVIGTAERHGRR